jgi:acyl-lipid omega-6 desaturase (Delta-12 desaturase)
LPLFFNSNQRTNYVGYSLICFLIISGWVGTRRSRLICINTPLSQFSKLVHMTLSPAEYPRAPLQSPAASPKTLNPNQPDRIPHRKVIRSWLEPIVQKNTAYALLLVAVDLSLFAAAISATVLLGNPLLQILASVFTGLIIGRLFILGHDACHQSLTRHRRLNRWLGRLVFMPSLTPYSLWDVGHNVVHHGYTNLKDFDFVWQPYSRAAYEALPAWRKGLERVYRSGWAPWLYYGAEIWWKRMFFPSKALMPTARTVFIADCLLVSGVALVWMASVVAAALATGQSVLWLLFVAFALPLLAWKALIGFVVYVHHTHTRVDWYDNKKAWSAASPFVSTTVHLKFGAGIGALLHHIMEHTAHHVDMSVPLYRLQKAQTLLEEKLPGKIIIQRFSWAWYFDTARRCKLYDLEHACWTDFSGQRTS